MIFRIFLLWLILSVSFYVIIDQVQAVEVVTQAGKILGAAIWAAIAAGVQALFLTGKLQKYRFSATLLVLSLSSALIVKFLPGYTIKDLNLLLTANILATIASILVATFFRKKTAPTAIKQPSRRRK
mgnify:CR=1 FL=1